MEKVEIVGYYPGVIGKIVELHATYYHENWGFDISFEIQVARELAEFLECFIPGRDGLWVAKHRGEFTGSVAIDGSLALEEGARLRWFIVEPSLQGRGIGGRLLREAMAFCRKAGHGKVFLWTFRGLDAARKLYEREGFRLSEEHLIHKWGGQIVEQRFDWNMI